MNKVILTALMVGGLLLLDSPEAAAHKEVRNAYAPSAHHHVDHRRARHMPYWLKRNKSFRRWYKRTHHRRYRHVAWHRLYEIYLWERVYGWSPRRHDRHYRDFDDRYEYGYRDHGDRRSDRRRGKRRHKD